MKVFEAAMQPGKATLARNRQDHWCILTGKEELDLVEALAKIQALIG